MKKLIPISITAGLVSGFVGHLIYDIMCKPDGYLSMDDEKNIYASLEKDPDSYRKGSRLVFIFKKF